jgi:hypothetical protein
MTIFSTDLRLQLLSSRGCVEEREGQRLELLREAGHAALAHSAQGLHFEGLSQALE